MVRKITVIDGHPDPSGERFCNALVRSYVEGARSAGHDVQVVSVASLDFPLLRSAADWEQGTVVTPLKEAQAAIGWADHIVFVHPLWLGEMPALLKGFLERVFRPGFAIKPGARTMWPGLLTGKSARVIITMGMPALVYRWWFRAYSLRSFEWNILRFVGIHPVHKTLIGNVAGSGRARLQKWLDHVRTIGQAGR